MARPLSPSDVAVRATLNNLDAQIVATIDGREVTRAELARAFRAVADATNWKLPVRADLTPAEVADLGGAAVIREAVIFFTGSVPAIAPGPVCAGDAIRVVAAGYYAAVGA